MLKIHTLSKNQKNDVFRILQEVGLETAHFLWTTEESDISYTDEDGLPVEVEGRMAPTLVYQNTEFYFQFELFNERNYCIYSLGIDKAVEKQNYGSWDFITILVRKWAENLKREIEEPDLWAEMEKYKTSISLTLPEQLLNEPIPAYEAEKISEKLGLLAEKIEEQFELTDGQSKFVRGKLDYLAEAAKRQRSMDWAHTLIGVSVTIAMGLALAPDRARELWELMRSLGEFIHLIAP